MSLSSSTEYLFAWIPTSVTVLLVILILYLLQKLLEKYLTRSGIHFRNHAILLAVSLIGIVAIIFSFPIADSARGQILAFLGVLLSAALALSATTLLGNILAGLMQRAVKNFRPGDFIQIEDILGRVTELGLFHTEIQTQNRDLVTLPNLYLSNRPVTLVQSSGTIVSAEVSLGYDVHHLQARTALKTAAEKSGLREPFVHIMNLGDFSVTYRIAGLLEPVKNLLTVRSLLKEKILDSLHETGIEIVSPAYMNQRQVPLDSKMIPQIHRIKKEDLLEPVPEKIAFDKAEEAGSIELLRKKAEELVKEEEQLKQALSEAKNDQEKEKIKLDIKSRQSFRERILARVEDLSKNQENKD